MFFLSIESKTIVKGRKGKGKKRKGREKISVESLQETVLGLTKRNHSGFDSKRIS